MYPNNGGKNSTSIFNTSDPRYVAGRVQLIVKWGTWISLEVFNDSCYILLHRIDVAMTRQSSATILSPGLPSGSHMFPASICRQMAQDLDQILQGRWHPKQQKKLRLTEPWTRVSFYLGLTSHMNSAGSRVFKCLGETDLTWARQLTPLRQV